MRIPAISQAGMRSLRLPWIAPAVSLGLLLALLSIVFGSALTMKVEYYRLDDLGFWAALRRALADMHLLPNPRGGGAAE